MLAFVVSCFLNNPVKDPDCLCYDINMNMYFFNYRVVEFWRKCLSILTKKKYKLIQSLLKYVETIKNENK